MQPLIQKLVREGSVVTDGAWGTELQARGLTVGEFPDIWNLLHPEKVTEVAEAYVAAGSRIILTNTFGANRLRLGGHNLEGRTVEINRQGVEISRRACGHRAFVFASIGPSGKLLVAEETTETELREAFEEQAKALAAAGADGLVVETMADLTEATIAVRAAHGTGLPVVGCMVFDSGKEKDRTAMGVTVEQAARGLIEAGADVIGANCGQGITGFIRVCARLRTVAADCPIWIKANAGLPELVDGRAVYRTGPDEFAASIPALTAAGANFVGGCCGTNPAFVRALRQTVGSGNT